VKLHTPLLATMQCPELAAAAAAAEFFIWDSWSTLAWPTAW